MRRKGRPTTKGASAEADKWRMTENLAQENTQRGRAARREIFKAALRPGPRALSATKFVLSCVRRIVEGEDPRRVMGIGVAGRPKDDRAARRRGLRVLRKIDQGASKAQAIKTVAAEDRTDETNVRRDLRHHEERLYVESCLRKLEDAWGDSPAGT